MHNSGMCWLYKIHSRPVLRTKWTKTQVYILPYFFHFTVSREESSFFAMIYISSRWLNVHHPHGVSARRHDGCLPALFLPVIEHYRPEEVSVAFNICSLSLCHCIIPAPIASSSWTHPLAAGPGSFSIFHRATTWSFSSQLRAVGRMERNVAGDVFSVWRQAPIVPARFWVITQLRCMLSHPSWCYKHCCHRVM